MPRQLRLEYAGAIYHVMNRGDRREVIVRDWRDRERFLATIGEACAKTGWQMHALCSGRLPDALAEWLWVTEASARWNTGNRKEHKERKGDGAGMRAGSLRSLRRLR